MRKVKIRIVNYQNVKSHMTRRCQIQGQMSVWTTLSFLYRLVKAAFAEQHGLCPWVHIQLKAG